MNHNVPPGTPGIKTVRAPDGILRLLRDLIHERTGIFFEDDRMDLLLNKLEPVARERGFSSFLDYYYALKDQNHAEWDQAWEALSVQETYFWRELGQVRTLVDIVIPEWFAKNTGPFRIWSAACATGEEPYSIALALAEAGLEKYPIEIMGSDASPNALEKARTAIYREKSFRALPAPMRWKYFSLADGGWRLSPDIVRRVSFQRVNLLDIGEVAPWARVQAMFCRNVFIYFSPHAIRQTVAMIAAKMPPGGKLFVGASESLLRLTADFELREIGDTLVYVKV